MKEAHLLPLNVKRVHFIGIGGYGMSALALILLKKGFKVSGSDIKQSPLTETLTTAGATVHIGHSSDNLGSAELVVYSTAVPSDNPELLSARERGLTLWHRSELLAALLNNSYGIAIAGAHGKTTTTAMAALLLEAGGLDPTAVIGGVLPAYGSNARVGQSQYLVAEADESDSSFTRYYPRLALVTGIEADHLEHYNNDYGSLKQAYTTFLSQVPANGTVILCADDPALVELSRKLACQVVFYSLVGEPPARENSSSQDKPETDTSLAHSQLEEKITENSTAEAGSNSASGSAPAGQPGFQPAADYYAANITIQGRSSSFDLYQRGRSIATGITLNVPGSHNISNAVGALALAATLGLDPAACAPALASFTGVGRRFEIIGTARGITVVDDYAHHPTEVCATLEAARPTAKRVLCLFQPHRYSRTAAFLEEFSRAFKDADLLFLHSVYPAGETPLPGATSERLADLIRKCGGTVVHYNEEITALEQEIAAKARPGDLVITMGAGDVTKSAPRILELLCQRDS